MERTTELSFGKKIANGRLELPSGLPDEAPLDVTFSLDRNGMLSITAVERSRGNKCIITVKTEGLSDAEVIKLQKQTSKIKVTEESDPSDTPESQEQLVSQTQPSNSTTTASGDDPWAL